MGPEISLNLGSLAEYLEVRLRALFGKDPGTVEWNSRLNRRLTLAIEQARWVQCVGMARPVAIQDIYQPLEILSGASRTTLAQLINASQSALLFAGPGRGKSTLLNRICLDLLSSREATPFLFILRSPGAVEDLLEFVRRISTGKKSAMAKGHRPILLVDGYDEASEPDRKVISAALNEFRTNAQGAFYLTCREFYDVLDLKAPEYRLAEFSPGHQVGFVNAFSRCYGVELEAEVLLRQLEARNLNEFATHPLLLTLICILKTGPLPELPNNSLGLLKRVFDTLTLRWDQQRGIARHSALPLDGEDRVRCLMRIAFSMRELITSADKVEQYARQFLVLAQRKSIDVRDLLRELAQWYGVLIPTEENGWEFIHRSVHDYLGARFWVESGTFHPEKIRSWDTRSAYAACLTPDATGAMISALQNAKELHAVSECLYNKAIFNPDEVSEAVIEHFSRYRPFSIYDRTEEQLTITTQREFFDLGSDKFLVTLLVHALDRSGYHVNLHAADVVVGCVLGALRKRRAHVDDADIWQAVIREFKKPDFTVQLGVEEPERFSIGSMFTERAKREFKSRPLAPSV